MQSARAWRWVDRQQAGTAGGRVNGMHDGSRRSGAHPEAQHTLQRSTACAHHLIALHPEGHQDLNEWHQDFPSEHNACNDSKGNRPCRVVQGACSRPTASHSNPRTEEQEDKSALQENHQGDGLRLIRWPGVCGWEQEQLAGCISGTRGQPSYRKTWLLPASMPSVHRAAK